MSLFFCSFQYLFFFSDALKFLLLFYFGVKNSLLLLFKAESARDRVTPPGFGLAVDSLLSALEEFCPTFSMF